MDFAIITTHNRQEQVKSLVKSIQNVFSGEVIVFDDASTPPAKPDCPVIRYNENHGRIFYWKLFTDIFSFLKDKDFKYFWILPDDIIIHPDLFEQSQKLWESISDPLKISLTVGHTHDRHYKPCWTFFEPVRMGEVVLTGWNDLCFMAERRFLEELNYQVEQPLAGYDYRSSGVGRYISRTLHGQGFNMYAVDKSLCEFPANESVMRKKETFENSMLK